MNEPHSALTIQVSSEYYQHTDLQQLPSSNLDDLSSLGLWEQALCWDALPRMHQPCIDLSGAVVRQTPKVFAIQLSHPLPKTIGFSFPESPHWTMKLPAPNQEANNADKTIKQEDSQDQSAPDPTSEPDHSNPNNNGKKTRLTPPRNLIRLEDRLYYVLQPPLESIVQNAKLTFPFQPFPYQMD
ncbi:MAG: hypothetical protein KGS49_11380, partial [Planctomycetes bacterium]|nr:hypothetical protein [Planctomycetota bacterium]